MKKRGLETPSGQVSVTASHPSSGNMVSWNEHGPRNRAGSTFTWP